MEALELLFGHVAGAITFGAIVLLLIQPRRTISDVVDWLRTYGWVLLFSAGFWILLLGLTPSGR